MTLDILGQVNWLAVIAGGVIYFALGALWYSPVLLGRQWQRSIGWDPEATPPEMNPMSYAIPFVAYLVMAAAIALLAVASGTDTIGEGVVLGLVAGIGLSLMHYVVDAAFDPTKPQPWTWFAISGSYNAIGLLIVAVIVSAWQ